MRRHTKNRCMIFFLLCSCVAVWIYVYGSTDHDFFYPLEVAGFSPGLDRWAAIKGDEVDMSIEEDEDQFDDDMFQKMAPLESQAFAEQKAVEDRLLEPRLTQKYRDDSPADVVAEVKTKEVKHRKHAHHKSSKYDETTLAVTESTTAALTTTEMPVTTPEVEQTHVKHKEQQRSQGHAHAHSRAQVATSQSEEGLVERTVQLMQDSNVAESEAAKEATQVAQETAPQVAPETAPQVAPETAPQVAPETAPQVAAETAPRVAPEPVPERPTHAHAHTHAHSHAQHHVTEHASHKVRPHDHDHRHPLKTSHEENTEDVPAVESPEEQVEWTPQDLLSANKTEAETASMKAFGQTKHFELLNRTVTDTLQTVTPRVVLNETKPTNEELQLKMMEYLPEAPSKKSERVNWEKFFSFIPNGLQSCTELFPNLLHQNPLPQAFQEAFIEFQNTISPLNIKDSNIAEHLEQFIVYYFLVRAPFVKTVCETGFGAGHSAFLWLQANPDIKVYMFDIGIREYSSPIADYLQAKFPGRLKVIWGDSVNTLPMFRQANKDVTCDIVVIDGGHTFRESFADYFHLRQMVTDNNIVLLDNYPDITKNYMEILGAVWEGGKRRGEVNEIFHCDYRPQGHGFSVGRFIPYSLTAHDSENVNADLPPS